MLLVFKIKEYGENPSRKRYKLLYLNILYKKLFKLRWQFKFFKSIKKLTFSGKLTLYEK